MFNHDHLSRNLQARLKAMVEILSVLFIFFFFSPRVDRIVGWYNYRYGVTCTHEATPVKHTQRAVITKVCHIEYTHIRARTHTRAGIMFGRGRIAVDEGCPPLRESSSFGLRYGLIGLNVCATLTALWARGIRYSRLNSRWSRIWKFGFDWRESFVAFSSWLIDSNYLNICIYRISICLHEILLENRFLKGKAKIFNFFFF